ncbi:MAG: hypothetical protein AAB363_00070 [Planctomycetota bacterium]
MVAVPLSADQIEAGEALLRRLDEEGVKVDAALWFYFADKEDWKLLLSLPEVIGQGPKAAYKEVQRILSGSKGPSGISLADVAVARQSSDLLSSIRGAVGTVPGISQLRFVKCVFNGQFIEDALIYRLV